MGFFLTDDEAARIAAQTQRARPRLSVAEAKTYELGARGCDNCALQESWQRIATPRMPISGNVNGDILSLGEAPGEQEDRKGVAFIGDSGQMLRRVIPGRLLSRVAFSNAARCHPFKNATPSPQMVHACSIHLEADIERYDFKAILGIGGVPLHHFWPGVGITRVHGARFPVQIGSKTLWYYPVFHPSFVLQTGGERGNTYPVFKADVARFFKEVDKWSTPHVATILPSDVIIPQNEQEARDLLARMQEPLATDIETATLTKAILRPYKRDARILCASFSDGKLTIAFPVEHPEGSTDWGLKLWLETIAKRKWIAHNAQFELIWALWFGRMQAADYEPATFDDSMALARTYYERNSIQALDEVSMAQLGVDIKKITNVNAARILDYPLAQILPYCGIDSWASALIYHRLINKVHRFTYQTFLGSIRSTAEMELLGLNVDLGVTGELKALWETKLTAARGNAGRIYEVREFERNKQVEFDIGKPEHIGEALAVHGRIDLPRTKKGGYSTDEGDLRRLAPDNPLVLTVLDYREAQKLISTYLDAIYGYCADNVDGLLHPQYTCMLTHTTRLSSEEPNQQNWPKRRHRELRAQIVAPKDHVLVAFDMKQLEARLIGMASRDGNLCTSIIKGEDIHSHWLMKIVNEYPDYIDYLSHKTNETIEKEILKGGRDIIKTDFVFASFYGAIAQGIAERTGLPVMIVEMIWAEFWERYQGVRKWGNNQRNVYKDTGSTFLMTGLGRHGIMSGNEPYNTPIQGTGAQIVLAAQNALSEQSRRLKDPYLHPRINIHDDLTFILPDSSSELYDYIERIAREMVRVRFDWQIVPLAVEVKLGYNWSELEYVTDFTGEYVR